MSVKPIQPLDYESPTARRRFAPAVWPPLALLIFVTLAAAGFSVSRGKGIPGGPFISIPGDLAPFSACVGVIVFAWRSLRHGTLRPRLAVATVVLSAAAIAILVAQQVMIFWLKPYARGALVSW